MLTLSQKAIEIIEKNFPMLWGVEELADMLGVTKYHLIRTFKSETGVTPGDFLEKTRIKYAKYLLAYRNYSIETTAHMVGYAGSNYFCKVFKRVEGETPAGFRKKKPLPFLSPEDRMWLIETDKRSYT